RKLDQMPRLRPGLKVLCYWSLVSGQWLVVSGQLSVVSCQWSVVSGQLLVVSKKQDLRKREGKCG
ncbi:MAG: hypothetical protein ACKO1I_13510, partial [Microcystis aeruginosa]